MTADHGQEYGINVSRVKRPSSGIRENDPVDVGRGRVACGL